MVIRVVDDKRPDRGISWPTTAFLFGVVHAEEVIAVGLVMRAHAGGVVIDVVTGGVVVVGCVMMVGHNDVALEVG